MNITLKINKGFKWYKTATFFFKGYFYVDDLFYEKEKALKYVSKIENSHQFKELLSTLNGVFTLVFKDDNKLYIASDITRSFPVFYTLQNNQFFFSDDIFYLKNLFKIDDFDKLSEIEFKASNYTHGKKTLLKNMFQIQPSEYVIVENNSIVESDFFYSYAIQKESPDSYADLKNQAVIAFENSFKRFVDSLGNKTAVIPLSGGYDSRLIAVMLKKHQYKNVICFTYGNKNSFEIENSKKAAKALGFKWFFVEYNSKLIEGYIHTNEFKEYAHFAGKLSSMPYLQEFFAVKYLQKENIITDDAIFIPGFAGDILGGSEFYKTIPENLKPIEIESLILAKKLDNYKLSNQDEIKLKKELTKNLKRFDESYHQKLPETVFEDYNIKERIAKYVFNSASFYAFFGYEYRFPFWDKELLDFFKAVPIKYKVMKTLFDDVLIEAYFKPHNVYFKKEIQPTTKAIELQKIKNKIKPLLPTFIKQKVLEKNDWNNYKPITQQMVDEMRLKKLKFQRMSKDYNEIIAQWYLYFSKNKF